MSYKTLIGAKAPAISLPDENGEEYNLVPGEDGRPIALFFYPQSGSIGCTREACQFRNAIAEQDVWKDSKVKVVGISRDPVAQQKAFVQKHNLTYPVLSDEKGEARQLYRTGQNLFGEARVTFVIDSKGIVRDTEDAMIYMDAHTRFVTGWLERLRKEQTN